MKKILYLFFLCGFLAHVNAQNSNCGNTGLQILPTENAIELCEGLPTSELIISLTSDLPNTNFFIVDVDEEANDGLGSSIVGISEDGIFSPADFGFTSDQNFAVRPFSFDINEFRNLIDVILNNTGSGTSCCQEAEALTKDFCDKLFDLGISSSENVNTLNDVWNILKVSAGNTGSSFSVDGFALQISTLQLVLNSLPEECSYSSQYCYAIGDNEQLFRILEKPQIVEIMTDTPHEITIESTISDGVLEYSIDPNGLWQTDKTIIDTPSEGIAFVREAMTQCVEEKRFINANLNVELGSFKADAEATTNLLHWVTATEINSFNFRVERSVDGINFIEIGVVNAAGNSQAPLEYVFRDSTPLTGSSYYRLAMEDINGRIENSPIENVQRKDGTGFSILSIGPNPSANIINVSIINDEIGNVEYFVHDVMGRRVRHGNQNLQIGINNFIIDATVMGTGMYIFTAYKSNYVVSAYKFVMH